MNSNLNSHLNLNSVDGSFCRSVGRLFILAEDLNAFGWQMAMTPVVACSSDKTVGDCRRQSATEVYTRLYIIPNAINSRYIAVDYYTMLHTVWQCQNCLGFNLTKDATYVSLTGELWGVFSELFVYIEGALYIYSYLKLVWVIYCHFV